MVPMGYPDNVLATGEQVVLHRHPHVKRLLAPVLVLLVSTASAAFAAALVSRTGWDDTARKAVSTFFIVFPIFLINFCS